MYVETRQILLKMLKLEAYTYLPNTLDNGTFYILTQKIP